MRYLLIALLLLALYLLYRNWRQQAGGFESPMSSALPPAEPVVSAVPDMPVPFGYKTLWLAIRTEDPEAVAGALGLSAPRPCNWRSGLDAVGLDDAWAFVTPPVEGWVLVVSQGLPHLEGGGQGEWRRLMEGLAAEFRDVQYFLTHRVVEFHAWARWVDGVLVRSYAYLGESGEVLLDEGELTPDEVDNGLIFTDPGGSESEEEGFWEREDLEFPSEEDVHQVAAAWSVSPVELDALELEPGVGWLGWVS